MVYCADWGVRPTHTRESSLIAMEGHQSSSLPSSRIAPVTESTAAAPFFSVVIPVHNRSALLKRALSAVLEQTFPSYEVIVVDDCSDEDIGGLVSSIGSDAVVCHRLTLNRGGGFCRNYGAERARGKYVAFLDSDDYWAPSKLHDDHRAAVAHSPDLIVSPVLVKKRHGRSVTKLFPTNIDKLRLFDAVMLHGCVVQTSGLTVKKEVLSRAAFDGGLRKHQDFDLYVRLDQLVLKRFFHPTAAVVWDIAHGQQSISRTPGLQRSIAWIESVRPAIGAEAYAAFIRRSVVGLAPTFRQFLELHARLTPSDQAGRMRSFIMALAVFARERAKARLLGR